jgi:hypothetical protein
MRREIFASARRRPIRLPIQPISACRWLLGEAVTFSRNRACRMQRLIKVPGIGSKSRCRSCSQPVVASRSSSHSRGIQYDSTVSSELSDSPNAWWHKVVKHRTFVQRNARISALTPTMVRRMHLMFCSRLFEMHRSRTS